MARRCNLCGEEFGCIPCLTDSVENARRVATVNEKVSEHEQSHLPYVVEWEIFFEAIC